VYMCVRGIDYASVHDFASEFRNCSDSVVMFAFHSNMACYFLFENDRGL
jgi:hypothetical protein